MSIPPIKIAFLDVGHGDSIVILLPKNDGPQRAILIDTPEFNITKKFLDENNVEVIDLVVITHSHLDHSAGIIPLVKKFLDEGKEVKKICYNLDRINHSKDQKKYKNLMKSLGQLSDNILAINPVIDDDIWQREIAFNEFKNIKLNLIHPHHSDLTMAVHENNCNNTSIVILFEYYDKKVLLTGDLESKGWHRLISKMNAAKSSLESDILKLPHHGDYYSESPYQTGTEQIIKLVSPKTTIISSAQNSEYQHPDPNTIEILKKYEINNYCTQVTDICHSKDKADICKLIMDELGPAKDNYKDNWCPCSGNIIISLSDTIDIEPNESCLEKIKSYFISPNCI